MQSQRFNQELLFLSIKNLLLRSYVVCKRRWCRFIKKILNTKGIKKYGLVMLLGIWNCLATTPFSFIVVLPLTFGSLFYIIDKSKNEKIRTQFAILFFFLLGHFISIFWWMFVPLTIDLSHFFWLIPFAIVGIPLAITLHFVPFLLISLLIWNKFYKNKHYDMLYFAFFFLSSWFFAEYIRGHFTFGGFPWMMFGHFVIYAFAIQPVRFFGIDVFSICFLALVLVPYFWIFKKSIFSRQVCLGIITAWLLNCLFGLTAISILKPKPVELNIAGSQINADALLGFGGLDYDLPILKKRLKQISWLSKSRRPTLLLLPEGSTSFPIISQDNIASGMGSIVPNDNSLLLVGGLYRDGLQSYNVIYSLTRYGDIVSMYKKQRLVPFGEYIPFRQYFPFLIYSITGGMIDFGRGNDTNNNLYVMYREMPIIYPVICYESIFPELVNSSIYKSRKAINSIPKEYKQQHHIKEISERGELIVNLTNDAWMKWSIEGYQHFLMTRFLAVSTNLPVVRLSNNGISAYIDNFGVVHEQTKLNTEDILFINNLKHIK